MAAILKEEPDFDALPDGLGPGTRLSNRRYLWRIPISSLGRGLGAVSMCSSAKVVDLFAERRNA